MDYVNDYKKLTSGNIFIYILKDRSHVREFEIMGCVNSRDHVISHAATLVIPELLCLNYRGRCHIT